MEAPSGTSLEALDATIRAHIAEHYKPEEGKGYVCRKDGAEIQQTTLSVSIHLEAFEDSGVGTGEVRSLPLPYCPECEGKPKNVSTSIRV